MVPEPLAPGVYDLPEAEYHRDPQRGDGGSASSTTLRTILKPGGPALVAYEREHPVFKDAYDIGSVTHSLTLGKGTEVVWLDYLSWQYKDAKAEREAARERGAVALLAKDRPAVEGMRDAIHAHPLAHALLTLPGAPEQTLIWREPVGDDEVWGRAMFDRWPDPAAGDPIGVDVKTTDDVDPEAIEKTVWSYKYLQQEDWYRRGYHAVHGVWPAFFFVFVRKSPPHLVQCVELDDDLRARGRELNDKALRRWAECTASGHWPGLDEEPLMVGAPRWVRSREAWS